jgi:hypothetical protein
MNCLTVCGDHPNAVRHQCVSTGTGMAVADGNTASDR